MGTELANLLGCLVGKLLALSLGHGTVLADQRAEATTPLHGRGVTAVHDLLNAALLGVELAVDASLGSLVGGNLGRHDSNLSLETSLLVLDRRHDASELGGETLLRLLHLVESGLAGSLHVLHSLGEASIVERGALGDGRSQRGGGTGESTVGASTVGSELHVHLAELAVGRLAGSTEGASNGLQGSLVAADGSGVHASDALLGGDLSGLDLVEQGLHVGLHLGVHLLGVLLQLGSVGIHRAVGLRDLLGSLSLEGKEGTVLVGHSILDSAHGTPLLSLGATLEGGTAGSVGGICLAETRVELHEVAVGPLHGLLQGLLGEGRSRADGVQDLTLHGSTSSLGVQTEVLDGGVGPLGESRDLVGDLHVHGSASLAVHVLHTLLESEGVHLTLVDHAADSSLQLGGVGLGHHAEHLATLGILHGVPGGDTCEALDLSIGLTVVLHNGGVEASEALQEVLLGAAKGIGSIEASTAGLLSHLLVSSSLDLGVTHESAVKAGSLLAEHTLSMTTVALHGPLDGGKTLTEVIGQTHHLGVGGGTVLGHEGTESLVVVSKLHLALVAKLHHALDLSVHVAVHTSLLEAVLGDDTLELGHTAVELGNLVLHDGSQVHDVDLEEGLRLVDASVVVGLHLLDVGDGGRKPLVLQNLHGVEGGRHLRGGVLEHHVSMSTVAGHLGADLVELGSGVGSNGLHLTGDHGAHALVHGTGSRSKLGLTLLALLTGVEHLLVEAATGMVEVVTSLLGVGLDLSSVRSDVRVGLANLGVGLGIERSKGTLPDGRGTVKSTGSRTLVLAHDLAGLGRPHESGTVTLVGDLGLAGEGAGSASHLAVQSIPGPLGVDGHLVQKHLLHASAGLGVVRTVLGHLGTDLGQVGLASSNLSGDLLLNRLEVAHQTNTSTDIVALSRDVRDDPASLLHIVGDDPCEVAGRSAAESTDERPALERPVGPRRLTRERGGDLSDDASHVLLLGVVVTRQRVKVGCPNRHTSLLNRRIHIRVRCEIHNCAGKGNTA